MWITIVWLLILLPGWLAVAVAETPGGLEPLMDSVLACRTIGLIVREDYDEALKLGDSLLHSDPALPDGYFIRAAVLNTRGIDFEDDLDLTAAEANFDSVQSICSRLISAGLDSPWVHYYRGTILGYRSYWAFRNGQYLKGYLIGVDAARDFSATLELDSTYYDAGLGLGTFLYYRSARAGLLRDICILTDQRDEGIALIAKAAVNGQFSRLPAQSALAWIDIEEGRCGEAIAKARELLTRYPDSRSFRWCLGRACLSTQRWSEAAAVYRELLASVRAQARNNHFNEVGCLHALARCYSELSDWENALAVTEEALSLSLTPEIADRKAADLKRLREIHTQAQKRIKPH